MREWFLAQLQELREKSLFYWVRVIGIIIVGLWVGSWIAHTNLWMGWRRYSYEALQSVVPLKPHPYATVLVLIEDEEYWHGRELAGRSPIRRDYLAKLIRALVTSSPAVIALDFNLESPTPEGQPIDEPLYAKETDDLVAAISEVPSTCAVVLPKTTSTPVPGHYRENSAIYDGRDFGRAKVLKGYISLPKNFRQVPLFTMKVQNGELPSFSEAIVHARSPRLVVRNKEPTLPTAAFVSLDDFPHFSSQDVLAGDTNTLEALQHNIVIVSGHWHSGGFNRGSVIDLHDSLLGPMPGALLHANYVESILNSRLYWEWKPLAVHVFEILAASLVALVFALRTGTLIQVLAVVSIIVALIGTSVLSLLIFASVFDFSIPVIMIIGHALVEPFVERKRTASPA